MDFGDDQRCLGEVDVQALSDRILQQDQAAWEEQAIRQPALLAHVNVFQHVSVDVCQGQAVIGHDIEAELATYPAAPVIRAP